MSDSPSDWVSFNEYLGIAGPEMEARLKAAQDKARELGTTGQEKLLLAGWESRNTGGDVTRTASYGEFLTLQEQARAARTAPSSSNPYDAAAAERMWQPGETPWAFGGMESAVGVRAAGDEAERQRLAAGYKAAQEKQAVSLTAQNAAHAANQKRVDEWKKANAARLQRERDEQAARFERYAPQSASGRAPTEFGQDPNQRNQPWSEKPRG